MQRVRTVALAALVSLLLIAGTYALQQTVNPPYADEQIRASIADTWEVEALATTVLLGSFFVSIALTFALASRSTSAGIRRLAFISVLLALFAGATTMANHIALTKRTAQLTGQSFGGFFGLP